MTYYHGGPHWFKVGKKILPPIRTGARCCSDLVEENNPHRRDKVYVVTTMEAALLYACTHRRGSVYEVAPGGMLEEDPDCDAVGLSFQCDEAIILRVHKMSFAQTAYYRQEIFA